MPGVSERHLTGRSCNGLWRSLSRPAARRDLPIPDFVVSPPCSRQNGQARSSAPDHNGLPLLGLIVSLCSSFVLPTNVPKSESFLLTSGHAKNLERVGEGCTRLSTSRLFPVMTKLTQDSQNDIFDQEKGCRLLPGQSPLFDLHQRRALVIHDHARRICLDFRRSKELSSSSRG